MQFKLNGDVKMNILCLVCCSLEEEELKRKKKRHYIKTTLRRKRGQDPGQCALWRKWSPTKNNQTPHQLTTAVPETTASAYIV